jgi:hypothetical protein
MEILGVVITNIVTLAIFYFTLREEIKKIRVQVSADVHKELEIQLKKDILPTIWEKLQDTESKTRLLIKSIKSLEDTLNLIKEVKGWERLEDEEKEDDKFLDELCLQSEETAHRIEKQISDAQNSFKDFNVYFVYKQIYLDNKALQFKLHEITDCFSNFLTSIIFYYSSENKRKEIRIIHKAKEYEDTYQNLINGIYAIINTDLSK